MDLFFRLFVCSDFHCNKNSLFSITVCTPCQVFVNVISTSSDFRLKTERPFFFLYVFVYATMDLLRVLFYDRGKHTQQFKYVQFIFVFNQQGKIDYSFGVKIHNRHRKADRLIRSCGENENEEVSALFHEKRKNRRS